MSLEGLRAWIGEVERKLGMRTRVFLALTVIAIGIGGAAIYLAIDARESSVSESDVQALQQQLEARIDELGAPASNPAAEAQPEAGKKGGSGTGGGAGSNAPSGATAGDASAAKLQELAEHAEEQAEANR